MKKEKNGLSYGELRVRMFRVRLMRDILLVFFIALFLIGGIIWASGDTLRKSYASIKLQDMAEKGRLGVGNEITNLTVLSSMLKAWGNEGLLGPDNQRVSLSLLAPVIKFSPLIRAIKIADGKNSFLMIRRNGDGFSVTVRNPETPTVIELQEWSSTLELVNNTVDSDLINALPNAESGWFRRALESDGAPVWSKPYTPVYTKDLISTIGISFRKSKQEEVMVAAIDVAVEDFFRQLESVKIGNAKAFLFDGQKNIFMATVEEKQTSSKFDILDITTPDAISLPQAVAARKWIDAGRPENPITFEMTDVESNKRFWAAFEHVTPGKMNVMVGVLSPESNITPQTDSRKGPMLSIWLVVIGSVISFFMIAYKYSRQIKKLPSILSSGQLSESELIDIISKGEGTGLEFKSTMRMNLHTGKAGKEIEIAWLKTVAAFLNTEGGIILLGVDDAGNILGLDADEFENDDKCRLHFKNLIQQHIGIEHVPHIRFSLCNSSSGTVGAVFCDPSAKPVFLNNKNEEAFYIRSGPSSIQLPIRQALDYIKQRKK